MTVFELDLDTIKPQRHIEKISGRQGDTDIVVRASIYQDGVPYDFSRKTVEFVMIRPDGEWIHVAEGCEQVGNTNMWDCTLPKEATAEDGVCKICYFVIKQEVSGFRMTTDTFQIQLEASATAEAHLEPYSDQLDKIIDLFMALEAHWEKRTQEMEEEFQQLKEYFNYVLQEVVKNNLDPLFKIYLDSMKDVPGGFVSVDWFKEFSNWINPLKDQAGGFVTWETYSQDITPEQFMQEVGANG